MATRSKLFLDRIGVGDHQDPHGLRPSRVAPGSARPGRLAIALGLASLLGSSACEFNDEGMGGSPLPTTSTTSTTSPDDTVDDTSGGSDTGPLTDGPRRRRLDIAPAFAGTNVGGGTTVLVVLDETRIEYADTQPQGSDLRFFGPAMEVFTFETERWDPSGRSFVWVYVDTPTLPDHLWMWYGDNSGFPPPDPAAAWDDEFAAIWHMNSTDGDLLDTTSADNDLQPFDFAGMLDQEGQIGLSTRMSPSPMPGETGPWDLESNDQLALTEAITIEAWISPAVAEGDVRHSILRKQNPYELRMLTPAASAPSFMVRTDDAGQHEVVADSPAPVDQWTYVVATYRADTGVQAIYLNGMLAGSNTIDGTGDQLLIDQSNNAVKVGQQMQGAVDELRVSRVVRSDTWIGLQYASMTDGLLSFGPPQPRE